MTDVDLSDTIAANSDQWNADDLMEPRTFTISDVTEGTAEQRIFIHLAESPGRTYRPSKSMRRVLVAAWGGKGSAYIGRRVTLYRDPEVRFGGQKVGGIKISHLSDIGKRIEVNLTETRGKKAPHIVEPLPDLAPEPTAEQVAEMTDADALKALWRNCRTDERKAQIVARVAELESGARA